MRRLPIFLFLALSACTQPQPRSMDDITSACDEQFGAATPASAQCQMDIVVKEVRQDRERRLDAADAASRR